ncbi:MAG: FAD synthetase family protein [Spirochaetota bacterium]|nr:FAD synthetase family protein [Spirochaetota bacterium]
MIVISWEEFLKGYLKENGTAAMSIGVFDGVHEGHQYLLNKIINNKDNLSIILTFKDNPRLFFKDKTYPGDIYTISQKLKTFSLMGVDIVILIDFSYEFSKLSGKEFLYLITENCDISMLTLGQNFRCGNRGMTSSYESKNILESQNIKVDIEKMTHFNNQPVSSTLIREAIVAGNLKRAESMLKRVFSLDIAGIPQIIRDKTIIIETNSIKQVLPPQGYYVVSTGSSIDTQECKINIDTSKIVLPLQKVQKLDFIKFI